MATSTTATKSNNLSPDEELKGFGVTEIVRYPSIKGIVLQITLNKKELVLPIGKNWEATLKTLNQSLDADLYFKGKPTATKRLKKEFLPAMEIFLLKNEDQIFNFKEEKSTDESAKEAEVSLNDIPIEVSITEANRLQSGRIRVEGLISSLSEEHKLVERERWKCKICDQITIDRKNDNILERPVKPRKCPACESPAGFSHDHKYKNARSIKLKAESTADDSLRVYVFGSDSQQKIEQSKDIKILDPKLNAKMIITGIIANQPESYKSNKFHTVVLAETVDYDFEKEVVLTSQIIKGLERFRKLSDYKKRLVSMFCIGVHGNEFQKFALQLLSISGKDVYRSSDEIEIRNRISTLMIGLQAEAKTKMSKATTKLSPIHVSVSGKNTSKGSLTMIGMLDDDGHPTMVFGAAPQANDGILFVNEWDKTPAEERDGLLDAQEEGYVVGNKYAEVRSVAARIRLIASANPTDEEWSEVGVVQRKDLPFANRELSRFDHILIFKGAKSKDEDLDYATKRLEAIRKRVKTNDNFLKIWAKYAMTFNPTLTPEAETIIRNFYVELRDNYVLRNAFVIDPRTLEKIHKTAVAIAQYYFTNTITEEIARETTEFFFTMYKDFGLKPTEIKNYIKIVVERVISIFKRRTKDNPWSVVDTIESCCMRHPEIYEQILRRNSFNQTQNRDVRAIYSKLRDIPNMKFLPGSPVKAYWRSDEELAEEFEKERKQRKSASNTDSGSMTV
jgi:DNA replicative helicase MCM subunit Mcm2 (Cdc46/Mcm family)